METKLIRYCKRCGKRFIYDDDYKDDSFCNFCRIAVFDRQHEQPNPLLNPYDDLDWPNPLKPRYRLYIDKPNFFRVF